MGQKNKITRRWAKRGTRPRAPHDQRTKWAYIFGAICPAEGKGAGLIMPWADTHAMAEHLKLISDEVAIGAHAILIVDQTGWHTSGVLSKPGLVVEDVRHPVQELILPLLYLAGMHVELCRQFAYRFVALQSRQSDLRFESGTVISSWSPFHLSSFVPATLPEPEQKIHLTHLFSLSGHLCNPVLTQTIEK